MTKDTLRLLLGEDVSGTRLLGPVISSPGPNGQIFLTTLRWESLTAQQSREIVSSFDSWLVVKDGHFSGDLTEFLLTLSEVTELPKELLVFLLDWIDSLCQVLAETTTHQTHFPFHRSPHQLRGVARQCRFAGEKGDQ